MSDNETRILSEVLGTMVAEAPPSVDFENLTDTKVMPEANRVRWSPWIAAAAGFAVIVIALGGVFALTNKATPGTDSASPSSDPTIFMVPEFTPEDLVLVLAEVASSDSLTQQFYYQEGLPFSKTGNREGSEKIVEIIIVDRAELPERSLSEFAATLRESSPDLILTEMLIRGKPTLVVEEPIASNELTEGRKTVFISESAAITSQVTAEQVTLDTAIAIAESLMPSSPDVFDSSNWRYQDLSGAASVWLNRLGLNQTDEDVWSARLNTICAAGDDLLGLAKQYTAEDAEHSVRADGALPSPGEAKQTLETIRLQSCDR